MAKTSLAIEPLIVPFSTNTTSPANAAGGTGASATATPPSFRVRRSSPITQLLATLGLATAAATSS